MIFDERMEPVENPDMDAGEVVSTIVEVEALWVLDEPEVTELRAVKRYENGGMVCEEIAVAPAKGHWEAPDWAIPWLDAGGDRNERFHPVPCDVYRKFGPRERTAIERADRLQEQLQAIPEQARAEIEDLRSCAASMDALACALYEELAAKDDEIASTDAAICSLYELAIGEGV